MTAPDLYNSHICLRFFVHYEKLPLIKLRFIEQTVFAVFPYKISFSWIEHWNNTILLHFTCTEKTAVNLRYGKYINSRIDGSVIKNTH